jgi:short-subunit dehydrogenase
MKTRTRGGIVAVASMSGLTPHPGRILHSW